MLNRTAIKTALVVWVRAATGLAAGQVVIADQNAPAPPTGTYVSLRIGSIAKVGQDQPGPINDAGLRPLVGQRSIPVSINAFRNESATAIEAISTSLDKEAHQIQLRAAGLNPYLATPALNLTAAVEKTMVEHHQMEVFFYAASQDSETVGIIQQAQFESTTEHPPAADEVEEFTVGTEYTP